VRERVLAGIRRSLGVTGAEPERRQSVAERLAAPPSGTIPTRGRLAPDPVLLFSRMATRADASVRRLASPHEVPGAVAAYLREHQLPARIRRGTDPRLESLPWQALRALAVSVGPSDGSDLAGLTHAEWGVAETGTLVLCSGPQNPTTLNFLVEHHIVVVAADDIVGDYETAWERLAERGPMPRAVNFITGPSRSADIQQTLLLGAHGPKPWRQWSPSSGCAFLPASATSSWG
jgi:L-lactate dehydrogenase complex protein LldG